MWLCYLLKCNKRVILGQAKKPDDPIVEHVDADFVPDRRRLYEVKIGMGFLELPQLELPSGILRQVAI